MEFGEFSDVSLDCSDSNNSHFLLSCDEFISDGDIVERKTSNSSLSQSQFLSLKNDEQTIRSNPSRWQTESDDVSLLKDRKSVV